MEKPEQELTRGQLAASTIKAHPDMLEAAIAAMIDAQIKTAIEEATARVFVILDGNDAPIGVRLSLAAAMAVLTEWTKQHIRTDAEHDPSDADRVKVTVRDHGDWHEFGAFIGDEDHAYLIREIWRFDPNQPIIDNSDPIF